MKIAQSALILLAKPPGSSCCQPNLITGQLEKEPRTIVWIFDFLNLNFERLAIHHFPPTLAVKILKPLALGFLEMLIILTNPT